MSPDLGFSIAAAAISLASLGVAIVSHRSSSRVGEQGNLIQERLLSLEQFRERIRSREENSASVIAELVQRGGNHYPQLVITNLGPAPASEITVLIDGVPILDHEEHLRPKQEVGTLGPGGVFSYDLYITGTSSIAVRRIDLRWSNANGADGHNTTTIRP